MRDIVIDRCCDLSIILFEIKKYISSLNAKHENVINTFRFISTNVVNPSFAKL